DEEGNRTSAAREIADGFDEVMIDEYQDSNFVQEDILPAVSHIDDGMDNYFCVGDVKQSIYRFRQARPDLFMEKYRAYAAGIGGRRIDLHQNFRSRPEILDGTNTIFRSIMRQEVGDIDYDDDAALEEGNRTVRLLNALGQEDHQIEVDVVDAHLSKEDKQDMGSDADDFKKNMLEAQIVATRIKDMVGKYTVEETKDGVVTTRPLTYGVVVIIMRSTRDWVTTFKKVLESQDIPCIAEQKKGFFSA
ncbi:MAG: UvrD-helicase domain-containing protein, partial [Lachnospiraceae bacterium]|nr:UvrD-helicase domain-containing protein [Candidatus Equihabitans merdae]